MLVDVYDRRSEWLFPVADRTEFGFPADVKVCGPGYKVRQFVRTTPANEDSAIFEELEGEE